MFTQKELGILRTACGQYYGVFAGHDKDKLTEREIKKHEDSIKTARDLADRFEEILMDYYSMQTNTGEGE